MPTIIVEGKGINEWRVFRLLLNQLTGIEQEADEHTKHNDGHDDNERTTRRRRRPFFA